MNGLASGAGLHTEGQHQQAALLSQQPTNLIQLRAALAAGNKDLRGLKLGEIDGLDLDLSGCNVDGSCFKEARLGHASLRGAGVNANAQALRQQCQS